MSFSEDIAYYKILKFKLIIFSLLVVTIPNAVASSDSSWFNTCQNYSPCSNKYSLDLLREPDFNSLLLDFTSVDLCSPICKNQTRLLEFQRLWLMAQPLPSCREQEYFLNGKCHCKPKSTCNVTPFQHLTLTLLCSTIILSVFIHTISVWYTYRATQQLLHKASPQTILKIFDLNHVEKS